MIFIVTALLSFLRFSGSELIINCRLANGLQGRCQPLEKCAISSQEMVHGIFPTFCHNGEVCCETESDLPESNVKTPLLEKSYLNFRTTATTCFTGRSAAYNFYNYETLTISSATTQTTKLDEKDTIINFMVKIGWHDVNGNVKYRCGGTLISPHFVLTAAHCAKYKEKQAEIAQIGTILGESETNSMDAFERIPVTQTHIHPQYSQNTMYNDIAVLKLEVKSRYLPACIWDSSLDLFENKIVAVGHDFTNNGKLQFMSLQSLTNEDCNHIYFSSKKLPHGISGTQMCAKNMNITESNACRGYIGGPLFGQGISGELLLIGLTNFVSGCATDYPIIYTKIDPYKDWVEEITN